MKRFYLFGMAFLLMAFHANAQDTDYTPKYALIENADYPTPDLAVATYNILDYGADPTGEHDCSRIIQTLCDKISGKGTISTERGNYQNISGGILYLPEGTYLMESTVTVPVGVTIRGDWKTPDKEGPVTGTILKACPTVSAKEGKSLFIMMPCTQVCNLTVWYPDQDINNIKEYAPTFLYGKSGFWGNDYVNIRNITLLNSYIGAKILENGGAGCPNVWNVYGSPLYKGIQMDGIGDVGRFDGISFAPDYWANSGLPGAPSKEALGQYLRNNATGVIMMRNDWSYTCNYDADSYMVAFHALPGHDTFKPNGHHYNFNLTNCATGVLCEGTSYCGIMFTHINTDERCNAGFRINAGSDGPVQLYECDLDGSDYALGVDATAGATINIQDSRIYGNTHILSGQLVANGSTFNGDVVISHAARTIFTGNVVKGEFSNNSLYQCEVSNEKKSIPHMPEYETWYMKPLEKKPAGKTLVYVTSPEYGCEPLPLRASLADAPDCAVAIQAALDYVGSQGGGIVYLPPGHYRMDHELSIPSGVELTGSNDVCAVPHGQGSILECFVGQGQENGTPFITMSEGSGLRGVCVNYPTQTDPNNIQAYPYTVRGNKDTYIITLSTRAAYKAVDLFTNKCDNHYIDGMTGHAFKNVITVGGGSENGIITNVQLNTGGYAYGYETKHGAWPNCVTGKNNNSSFTDDAFSQNKRELDFLAIQDVEGEILYNNFLFGCNKGMLFQKGENGKAPRNIVSLGNAVDGAVNTFVIDAIDSDLDLTNSQIVALDEGSSYPAYFITVGEGATDHTINFFSSDLWGSGKYLAKIKSGTINMFNTSCNQSGSASSFNVADGAKVNVSNGVMKNIKKLAYLSSHQPRISIENSVLDPTGATTSSLASYEYNLPTAWEMSTSSCLAPRDGWFATANNDQTSGKKAGRAIDGDGTSRWSTDADQTPGQWFCVDFGKEISFNSILMDTMKSPSDGPAGYVVETQTEGSETWTQVAEGSKGSSMFILSFDNLNARKLRITQTGSKSGNYWSIYEFNVANMGFYDLDSLAGIVEITTDNVVCPVKKGIYDLQGRYFGTSEYYLPAGIYIINGKKIIKK